MMLDSLSEGFLSERFAPRRRTNCVLSGFRDARNTAGKRCLQVDLDILLTRFPEGPCRKLAAAVEEVLCFPAAQRQLILSILVRCTPSSQRFRVQMGAFLTNLPHTATLGRPLKLRCMQRGESSFLCCPRLLHSTYP